MCQLDRARQNIKKVKAIYTRKEVGSPQAQVSFGGWFLIRLGRRKSYLEAAGK